MLSLTLWYAEVYDIKKYVRSSVILLLSLFVNVLELHHSMENDKWYNKKSFDLAFHFSFNQNKLWTN
jgi:hypothetical protein